MVDILHDLSDTQAVIEALEHNGMEFLLSMGRAGGGEERDDPEIQWIIGGSPIAYHNCVVRANLKPERADAAITDVKERLRKHRVAGSWHIGPSDRPIDLPERLAAHGFSGGQEPGMAADLLALNEAIHVPDGLVMERVRNEADLQVWAETLAQGFGEGELEAFWARDVFRKIGLGDESAWWHYLGYLKGEPVATSSVLWAAGVAGIYFVFTVERARRQGIGAAITLAALREARESGYRVGVLGASEPGYPVYVRLGFREICRVAVYEWTPPELLRR